MSLKGDTAGQRQNKIMLPYSEGLKTHPSSYNRHVLWKVLLKSGLMKLEKKEVRTELYVLDNERFILYAAVFLASRLQAQGSCQMSCGAAGTEDLEMHWTGVLSEISYYWIWIAPGVVANTSMELPAAAWATCAAGTQRAKGSRTKHRLQAQRSSLASMRLIDIKGERGLCQLRALTELVPRHST